MNQTKSITSDLSPRAQNLAPLGGLVKIVGIKRTLIRAIEMFAAPFVFVCERFRPAAPQSADIRSILVLEYWNLGDIVMELPFLQNLRIQYPTARIVLLTSPKVADLLKNEKLVDEFVVVRVPWTQHYSRWRKYNPFSRLWIDLARAIRSLRAYQFDIAFSARADVRDNLIMWIVNVRRRVGYGFGGGAYCLTDVVQPDMQRAHFSDRWLRLLEHVGKSIPVQQPCLQITAEEMQFADEYLDKSGIAPGEFLVGVHSGARSATRHWGRHNFEAVASSLQQRFPIKILWFEDPDQVGGSTNPGFVYVSLPLRRFMAVLSRCQLLICNDSGPMHIASALNIPVVAVFGPTEPTWFGPRGVRNRVVIQPGFWCRPCFDYCRFDEPYCLRTITVESVLDASVKSLSAILSAAHTQAAVGQSPFVDAQLQPERLSADGERRVRVFNEQQ